MVTLTAILLGLTLAESIHIAYTTSRPLSTFFNNRLQTRLMANITKPLAHLHPYLLF